MLSPCTVADRRPRHEQFAAPHLPSCAGEPLVSAAPQSEPAAPPRAERAPAPAAKRRKTAAGSKDKSYLPSRGSANYAFLVCLLEVRPHLQLACPAGLAHVIIHVETKNFVCAMWALTRSVQASAPVPPCAGWNEECSLVKFIKLGDAGQARRGGGADQGRAPGQSGGEWAL